MKRRLVLAGALFFLAPVIALHAQISAENASPRWAEDWNGFSLAKRALGEIRITEGGQGQANIAVNPEALALAKAGYAKEPLAANSHFILAKFAGADEREVLELSQLLTRRGDLVSLSLLDMAAREDDLQTSLPLVDQLARLKPDLGSQFVGVLTDSLDQEEGARTISAALALQPSWERAFWRNVPNSSDALDRFLALRDEHKPEYDEVAASNLISVLIEVEDFERAFDVHADASTRIGEGHLLPPIDWRPRKTRSSRAEVLSRDALGFYVEQGTAGELARRVVRLETGTYTLNGNVEIEQGSGEIRAKLECAQPDANVDWQTRELSSPPSWQTTGKNCEFAWLIITGSAWDSTIPFRGHVKELVLRQDDKD